MPIYFDILAEFLLDVKQTFKFFVHFLWLHANLLSKCTLPLFHWIWERIYLQLNHLNHLRLSITIHIYNVIILNLHVKTSFDFLAFIFAILHANFLTYVCIGRRNKKRKMEMLCNNSKRKCLLRNLLSKIIPQRYWYRMNSN